MRLNSLTPSTTLKRTQATDRVKETVSQTSARVQKAVGDAGKQVREALPEPARQGVASAAAIVDERLPLPVVVVVALLVGFLLGRRRGKKLRRKAPSQLQQVGRYVSQLPPEVLHGH